MRTVLVTGATGAIGSDLTRRLVIEENTKLRLLVRAQSPEHLNRRLHELFRFWDLDAKAPSIAGRVEAFRGDVTQHRLGLDEPDWDRLSSEVTHVVHAAGNVKLNRPLPEARQAAVDSLRHVLSFVESCRRTGAFQKLDYVSTVGVGGLMPGPLPERAIVERRAFRNSYEAAKAEAETVLLEEMDRGLSATIHRPSMVVGDSLTGKIIQFQVFYYLCEFLSGARTLGIVPQTRGFQLDIIPVDYVSQAIHMSSTRPDAAGKIFHLCSGSEAPTLEELTQHVRHLFAACGRPTPKLRSIPLPLLRTVLPVAGWCVGKATRRALQALPFFLAYLDTPREFGNVASRAFFSSSGLSLPAPDSYVDVVLTYYLSGKGAAAA